MRSGARVTVHINTILYHYIMHRNDILYIIMIIIIVAVVFTPADGFVHKYINAREWRPSTERLRVFFFVFITRGVCGMCAWRFISLYIASITLPLTTFNRFKRDLYNIHLYIYICVFECVCVWCNLSLCYIISRLTFNLYANELKIFVVIIGNNV